MLQLPTPAATETGSPLPQTGSSLPLNRASTLTPDLGKLCQGIINTRSEIEQIDLTLELVRALRRFAMASVDNALADAEGSLEDSAEDERCEAAGNAAAFYADWRNDEIRNDNAGFGL